MIYFVTSSDDKARETQEILGIKVERVNAELEEMQSLDCEKVVERKLLDAIVRIGKFPVLVEDTSLCFNAWKTHQGLFLPGPLIKYFLKLGLEELVKMLSPFDDKTAFAVNTLGYVESPVSGLKYFEGLVSGEIVSPRGPRGFGWDPIFKPQGYEQTYAEMDPAVKNKISHRRKSLDVLKDYLVQYSE